jgi:hypothetical protein
VEHLLEAGFRPSRTLVVVFGHDEEIGGFDGARPAYAWVEMRLRELQASPGVLGAEPPTALARIKPVGLLLDEGLFVLSGAVPGVPPTLKTAMICTEVWKEGRSRDTRAAPSSRTPSSDSRPCWLE